jgi:hypothetical protein
MRRRRRGRKLSAAVAVEAIEASAGLRPDQPITEAAVGRVLRHRSAGGLAHPSVVRKMAASPSVQSATLACRWAACVSIDPPRTTPNAVEIGTEKTRSSQRYRGRGVSPVDRPSLRSRTHLQRRAASSRQVRQRATPRFRASSIHPAARRGFATWAAGPFWRNERRRLHFAGRYRSFCATFDADGRSGCETRTNAVMPTIRLPRTANAWRQASEGMVIEAIPWDAW